MTTDFTLIEPNVDENNFYPPGIGLIVEVDVETGDPAEFAEFSSSSMRSASRNQMTQISSFV